MQIPDFFVAQFLLSKIGLEERFILFCRVLKWDDFFWTRVRFILCANLSVGRLNETPAIHVAYQEY